MKSIYILLTKSNTIVSKAIHLATDDQYTHCSLSFKENLQPLYSFARKYPYTPLPAGMRQEPLLEGFYKKNNDIPCALYKLNVNDESYDSAKEIVENMMKNSDIYKYNSLGLILCKLNIPYDRKTHYFCSQFVSEVLVQSQAIDLPKSPSLMKPADYTQLHSLECIFTGTIKHLVSFLNIEYNTEKVSL